MKNIFTLLFIILNLSMTAQCFERVIGGDFHTLSIKTDGTIFSWGDNGFGQLGDGTNTDKHSPTQILGGDWVQVTSAERSTLGIKSDGTMWAWGIATPWGGAPNLLPVQIGNDADWQYVVTKNGHTSAIKTDGTLWSWGNNSNGQLGIGYMTNQVVPIQVGSDNNWKTVAKGLTFTAALKTDGSLWVWGYNNLGVFGTGTYIATNSYVPIQVGTANDWETITCGYGYSDYILALKTDGTLWVSGFNQYDQAASPFSWTDNFIHQLGDDNDWQSVAAGGQHNVAIKTDGTLWAWGLNNYGQLGNGTIANQGVPTQIGTDTDWDLISCGKFHTIATKSDGTFYTWGYNNNGQLGDDTMINKSIPTAITCPTTTVLSTDFIPSNYLYMYPNPVTDFFNLPSIREITNISIYDLWGREVFSGFLSTPGDKIDISHLSSGTYLIKMLASGQLQTFKAIKK